MSNRRDFTKKNPRFTGTGAIEVPTGATGERPTGVTGQLRYNNDLGFLEQYNATGWAGIDAPPTVTNITGTINEDTDSTITINGTNFKSGSIVYVEGPAVSNSSRALSTTYVGSSQLTANTNASSQGFVGGTQFNIKVVNPSGLSAVLDPGGTVDRDPVWSTPAGSVATIYDQSRTGVSIQLTANDPDGGTITYTIASGSLPSGLSLGTNGIISGTASAVGSDTTSNFTVTATSSVGSETADRAFSITIKPPVTQTLTANTDTSFSIPSGVTTMVVEAWGGGGGAGGNAPSNNDNANNANGGDAGYVKVNLDVTGLSSFNYRVGTGGGAGLGRVNSGGGGSNNTGGGSGGGGTGNGSNGGAGGGGGGSTYIRNGSTALVVAAGAGGGGGHDQNNTGVSRRGGNGGYSSGSTGATRNRSDQGDPGGGASQSSNGGGGGGAPGGSANSGSAGSGTSYANSGGNGGTSNTPNGAGGGGGGSGYRSGGGGGGAQGGTFAPGGAGGGGASYYHPNLTSSRTATNGYGNAANRGNAGAGGQGVVANTGNPGQAGKLIISY